MGSEISAPKSGAVMPFILFHMQLVFTSVLLVSLCSLTSDPYSPATTSPSASPLLLSLLLRVLSMSTLLPPLLSLLFTFLRLPFLHLSQGLFGGCAVGVSSGRGGERERNHLQCESGDTRPGAAVGEGTDGRPQPRLSAR